MANTIVTMTSPDGATLNTAGTYCEGDIEVIPKLQSKTATTGEIVTADDGYVGLESVDTNPVFEAGKKSERDAFWDAYQQNGARNDYASAFAGDGWTKETFRPKYNLAVADGYMMFRYHNSENEPYDLAEYLENLGITIDLLYVSQYMFAYANVNRVPFLDFSKGMLNMQNTFVGSHIVTIDKIKVVGNTIYSSPFVDARELENLTIEGVIGQNGFNVSWSPLSKASLTSVVNALSSTTTGLTVTLRLAAVNTAFETSAGAADGSTSEEWLALAATKPNWNISLINS